MDRQTPLLSLPGMLLIGATGRNAGKTEFACRILEQFRAGQELVGLKVTIIRETGGACPRGGKGCGVCTSFEGPFLLTEESCREGHKDTARLLRTGARRVFWLRVQSACIREGLAALLDRIGTNAVTVCESNSLRLTVRPGLFLMVRDSRTPACKPTARAVLDYADRIVLSDGETFDMSLDDLSLHNGRWRLREHATAVVMAGGASSRMGREKHLLPIEGHPMIEHICTRLTEVFDEVLISANDPARFAFLGLPVVPDRIPDRGPLMGLCSALEAASHDRVLAVACDMPHPDLGLAHRMLTLLDGCDAVIPRLGAAPTNNPRRTLLEPLYAVYRKSLAPTLAAMLDGGERRVRAIADHCRTRILELAPDEAPVNLNTTGEYHAYVTPRQTDHAA